MEMGALIRACILVGEWICEVSGAPSSSFLPRPSPVCSVWFHSLVRREVDHFEGLVIKLNLCRGCATHTISGVPHTGCTVQQTRQKSMKQILHYTASLLSLPDASNVTGRNSLVKMLQTNCKQKTPPC